MIVMNRTLELSSISKVNSLDSCFKGRIVLNLPIESKPFIVRKRFNYAVFDVKNSFVCFKHPSNVITRGIARVIIPGGKVYAYGHSTVYAYNDTCVLGMDNSKVFGYGKKVAVILRNSATGYLYKTALAECKDDSRIFIYDNARALVHDNCDVYHYGSKVIKSLGDTVRVFTDDDTLVTGSAFVLPSRLCVAGDNSSNHRIMLGFYSSYLD